MIDSSAGQKSGFAFPPPINLLRGVGAALAAAVLAYFAVAFLWQRGYYAMMLPGLMIGMACGYLSGSKSLFMGLVALVIAVIANVLIEWQAIYDVPLTDFLSKYLAHSPMRLLMRFVGAFMAFWFGTGR